MYFKTWKFFRKIFDKIRLKVARIKKSEFQTLHVWRTCNLKHSFFILWIFYCLEKLAIKMWFLINLAKILKGCYFVVGGSKNLKLSTKAFFGVSFQKTVLSSFLPFLSVCYQDDLSDTERNEIASLTVHNFNNNWIIVEFSETITLCRNIWLIENWKCQLFLFFK